jgi:hypothetical protein
MGISDQPEIFWFVAETEFTFHLSDDEAVAKMGHSVLMAGMRNAGLGTTRDRANNRNA